MSDLQEALSRAINKIKFGQSGISGVSEAMFQAQPEFSRVVLKPVQPDMAQAKETAQFWKREIARFYEGEFEVQVFFQGAVAPVVCK